MERKLKVCFASKYYYRRGGVESYIFKTKQLLEQKGHTVIPFSTDYEANLATPYSEYFCKYYDLSEIRKNNVVENFRAFTNMFYNWDAYKCVKNLCEDENIDIFQGFGVTKHLSPSIFHAAQKAGVKTIARLSDYALICPNSTGLDGSSVICSEFDCISKSNYRCIKTKCVQDSRIASLVGYLEVSVNNRLGSYLAYVDHWIAPSQFIRDTFIKYFDIQPSDISYLPIFFDASSIQPCYEDQGYILYAGRIGKEKGIDTLLRLMELQPSIPLIMAGTGPLDDEVRRRIEVKNLNVEFLGYQDYSSTMELIKKSRFLVLPSEWYENSPNIVLEAFAHGKPVVASDIGGIPELVRNGDTGYLFEAGNICDFESVVVRLYKNTLLVRELGKNARRRLDSEWDEQSHYSAISAIYESVLSG